MTTEARHSTGIQWTHVPGYIGATWNPTVGCTRVSPGCDNCYAFTLHDQRYKANTDAGKMMAGILEPEGTERHIRVTEGWRENVARVGAPTEGWAARARSLRARMPLPEQYDVPFSTVQMLDEKRLTAPLRAKAPHAYFVDSMADLFHEDVTDDFLDEAFAVMALAPRHIFMILTKRPERMQAYATAGRSWGRLYPSNVTLGKQQWPLPNVWLGVSAENQEWADKRIPVLLDTPAAVRFVSYEPALGPIDFGRYMMTTQERLHEAFTISPFDSPRRSVNWVVVGGESGARAREFDLAWARSTVEQCQSAGVAVFVKQLGAHPVQPDKGWGPIGGRLHLSNRHGSDPAEWPEDLRVREFPR